jgi:hypothetical protein
LKLESACEAQFTSDYRDQYKAFVAKKEKQSRSKYESHLETGTVGEFMSETAK